ncbi:hypothetical protein [Streptomyces sp. 35G-GA-8]|uniref:hypothetical protein n=1 Tax=Streptomyces sp. 35G-GA-8 TaxID=2939434 RepID=UPI00201EC076|nr:hypothetical protein [Streptomyces sp. 35G-GA-8]MCL7382548.1 hypothetical protein [Streptomyces sp. 35G-GA-8]
MSHANTQQPPTTPTGPSITPSVPGSAHPPTLGPTPVVTLAVILAVVTVPVALLVCGFSAYLAYEHPNLREPITIAFTVLATIGTMAGVMVSALRR